MEIVYTGASTTTTRRRLERRVAEGRGRRLYPGTHLLLDQDESLSPESLHATMVFAATRRHRHGVVSGLSAAVLHGLPLLTRRVPTRLHVTRERGGHSSQWVVARRSALADDDVVEIAGLPVTSIRRTVQDLALELDPFELLAVADRARAYGVSLDGVSDRWRGRTRLGHVERHACDRSESFGESWSRSIFVDHGIRFPMLQPTICDGAGEFVARVDFATPNGLIGEFDGRSKYDALVRPGETAADVVMREKRREARLQELGWTIIRWDWRALHDPARLVRRIESANARCTREPAGSFEIRPMKAVVLPNWQPFLDAVSAA